MNEKKKRYPTDRIKLHEMLDKKKRDLADLQAEVEELEARCLEADHTEIHATVEMYNISVEQLKEFLAAQFGSAPVPDLPAGVTVAAPVKPLNPDDEEEPLDDEV